MVNEPSCVVHTEGYKEDNMQKYYLQLVNGTKLN